MKTIKISDIQIAPDRQRKSFDLKSLAELGESIKARGLLQPIVLREFPIDKLSLGKAEVFLVAGERRIRAITDLYEVENFQIKHDGQTLPLGEIPYVTLGELSELERAEAEYDENSKRVNLTWQEDAEAVRRLAKARGTTLGVSPTHPAIVISVAQTAAPAGANLEPNKLGVHRETARRQIIVAEHMADPDVKGAKDVDEAWKILKRKEEVQRRVALATEVGRTYSAETAHKAFHADSLDWMAKCEAEQFDVICTDPIYGINADQFGDSGGKAAGAHQYDDSYETWRKHVIALAYEGYRITKAQAHLYAFCDITRFEEFKERLTEAGWDCFRTPLIWHKPNASRTPWVDGGPQRKYEIILYARKGKKPVTKIFPDLVTYTADENLGHNAQKPVALFVDLLKRSCNPGDSIIDPFCGSGPIFPAAQELKLKATGIEVAPESYAICLKRLDLLKAAPELAGL